jgi:hypothetical protein
VFGAGIVCNVIIKKMTEKGTRLRSKMGKGDPPE